MIRGILLDTHVWEWIGNGLLHPDPKLVDAINGAGDRDALFISSISLYELAAAYSRDRLSLPGRTLEEWFAANLRRPGPRVLEISPKIVMQTTRLPPNFHGDPADRLIAATAQVEHLGLVTHDALLLRFGAQGLFTVLKARQKRIRE